MSKDCGNHHGHDKRKLYKLLLVGIGAFIGLVGLVILIVWLVLRPAKPAFYLQDAAVLTFNRTDVGPAGLFLTTTIGITVSTRNPNGRVGVHYDELHVYASYQDQQITLATAIPPGYQGHREVIVWSPFLWGDHVPVAPYLCASLARDQSAGILLLHIKMDGRVRWKVGSWTSSGYHIFVSCPALLTFCCRPGEGDCDGAGSRPVVKWFPQTAVTCSVDV